MDITKKRKIFRMVRIFGYTGGTLGACTLVPDPAQQASFVGPIWGVAFMDLIISLLGKIMTSMKSQGK